MPTKGRERRTILEDSDEESSKGQDRGDKLSQQSEIVQDERGSSVEREREESTAATFAPPPSSTTPVAFAIYSLPPKPVIGENKPDKFKAKGPVTVPATTKPNKKSMAMINSANTRITQAERAVSTYVAHYESLKSQAKGSIDALYSSTKAIHKKYTAAVEQLAKKDNRISELSLLLTNNSTKLTEAKKEIKALEAKKNKLDDKVVKIAESSAAAVAKASAKPTKQVKSPTTANIEKVNLRVFEAKSKLEAKQQMKERDREHDNDVRNQRIQRMQSLQLGSYGDGRFVSNTCSIIIIICDFIIII